ncbi:hypothetical protein V7S43_017822 [Phytophthora oleae]|uniref:Uncharacterized protein n=1 Tax=Phytophthora oleae TaxID=2107226 RepID=A0ABD3ET22_9STRA
MSREVWFQLVDGKDLTSVDCIDCANDAKVFRVRDAVFAKVSRALPANVIASDLTVFANRAAFGAKQKLEEDSPIGSFGGSTEEAFIVQAPSRIGSEPRYFILPEIQEQVDKAVFVIIEEDEEHKGVGIGVLFTPTLAVTCDHNLTDEHSVGSLVSLALKNEMAIVEVVARNPDLNFAILKSSQRRFFIPPWNGRPDELSKRYDLVLASFRLGLEEYDLTKNQLGFAQVSAIGISPCRRHLT